MLNEKVIILITAGLMKNIVIKWVIFLNHIPVVKTK